MARKTSIFALAEEIVLDLKRLDTLLALRSGVWAITDKCANFIRPRESSSYIKPKWLPSLLSGLQIVNRKSWLRTSDGTRSFATGALSIPVLYILSQLLHRPFCPIKISVFIFLNNLFGIQIRLNSSNNSRWIPRCQMISWNILLNVNLGPMGGKSHHSILFSIPWLPHSPRRQQHHLLFLLLEEQ